MYEAIRYEVDGPVATITLNRPEKLNALTTVMRREIERALVDAEHRDEVVGIVLTGAGRGFCAGVDMGELQVIQAAGLISAIEGPPAPDDVRPGDPHMGEDFAQGLAYMLAVRKPVIGAINGACAGMGFSLAMFCDMRFAAENAIFTTAYAHRGLVAEHGMSWILPRLIGPSRALDLLWSGRKFTGVEAMQLGVVNAAVPADQLLATAQGYVRSLAATASPGSLMYMKRQVYRHLMQPLGSAMTETQELMDASVTWPDFKEGIASFLERRPPRFAPVSAG